MIHTVKDIHFEKMNYSIQNIQDSQMSHYVVDIQFYKMNYPDKDNQGGKMN